MSYKLYSIAVELIRYDDTAKKENERREREYYSVTDDDNDQTLASILNYIKQKNHADKHESYRLNYMDMFASERGYGLIYNEDNELVELDYTTPTYDSQYYDVSGEMDPDTLIEDIMIWNLDKEDFI